MQSYHIAIMAHHSKEEKDNFDYVYYIVGLVSGLFTGAILRSGFIWVPVLGVFGLLLAAMYLKLLVKGREDV